MSFVQYHAHQVPAPHAQIIRHISEYFGRAVEVLGFEDEWVRFRVPGWVDKTAAIQLETQKGRILGDQADTIQILAPQSPLEGDGLWIRSVQAPGGVRNGMPGIWFY